MATATLVIAANAPDVDVLSSFRGEYYALAFRRGITHGLPAAAVLPFLVAGSVLAWDRWMRRRRRPGAEAAVPGAVLLLSFLGVISHPALDSLNIYGTRWGRPFWDAWSYGDTLFILDPWLWLVLGSSVFLARAGSRWLWAALAAATTALMVLGPVPRLASAVWVAGVLLAGFLRWSGRPGPGAPCERAARVGVGLTVAYIALMGAASVVGGHRVMAEAEAAGLEPSEAMYAPAAANPFLAEVEVVTPTGYVPGEYRWLRSPSVILRPADVVPFLRVPDDVDPDTAASVLAAARAAPDVRNYLVWSRYPYAKLARDGSAWLVRWSDARYDDREGAGGLGGVTVGIP